MRALLEILSEIDLELGPKSKYGWILDHESYKYQI